MTITAQNNRYSYSGNGVTTAFAYSGRFLANTDLVVVLVSSAGVETTKTLTTHYTVTGAGDAGGGTVTMLTAPASGETLVIYADPAITQSVDLVEGGALPVETQVELPLDRTALIARRLADRVGRSLRLSDGDPSDADLRLPSAALRAEQYVAFDEDGELIMSSAPSTSGSYVAPFTGGVSRTWTSKVSDTISVKDFGAVGDGVTDDTAAINLAIAYANLTGNVCIYFPGGDYLISGALTAITASDITIVGAGVGLSAIAQSDGSVGTFLTIGQNSGSVISNIGAFGISLRNDGTVTSTDAAIVVQNAQTVTFSDIAIGNAAAIATLGSATHLATAVTFNNIIAALKGSLGADFLQFKWASSIALRRLRVNSNDTTNSVTHPLAAYIGIVPVSGGLVDTIHLSDVTMQEIAEGRPFGIKMDHTLGQIVNVWVTAGAYDHTKYAAWRIFATAGAFQCRHITFTGTRMFTGNGRVGYISNAGTGVQDTISFNGCIEQYLDGIGDTAYDATDTELCGIKMTGNATGMSWAGGTLRHENATVNVTAAMYTKIGNFQINGVSFGGRTHGSCDTDYAVQTAANIDNFVITGNLGGEDMNLGFVDHFAYTTGSNNRIVHDNSGDVSDYLFTYPLMDYGGYELDGATDYLDTNALTGITDTKTLTACYKVRFDAQASATSIIHDSTGIAFRVLRNTNGEIQVLGENAGGTVILSIITSNGPCEEAGEYVILISFNLAVAGSSRIYVNDVPCPITVTTFTDDSIDFTVAEHSLGASVAGASFVDGALYVVYFNELTALEFNTESVRRRFHDSAGVMAFMGKNGELPTGSAPICFHAYDPYTAWTRQRGRATSSWTERGTPGAPGTAVSGQYGNAQTRIVTVTADYTVVSTDRHIINDRAASNTLTLPSATTCKGREIYVRTIQAQTVVSASSNVVPLAGGAASTGICSGSAGSWALIVADGTNWQIMAGV